MREIYEALQRGVGVVANVTGADSPTRSAGTATRRSAEVLRAGMLRVCQWRTMGSRDWRRLLAQADSVLGAAQNGPDSEPTA